MSISDIPIRPIASTVYGSIPRGYTPRVSLARNIRKYRRAAELRQDELGEKCGVGQGAVSKWESGKSEPDASSLPIIATILGVSLDALLKGESAQYDAHRDLSGHGIDVQTAPLQPAGGAPNVSASPSLRELQDRVTAYRTIIRKTHRLAEQIRRTTALSPKGKPASGSGSGSSGGG